MNEKSAKKRTNELACDTNDEQVILTNDIIIKLLNDNKEMREIITKQQQEKLIIKKL